MIQETTKSKKLNKGKRLRSGAMAIAVVFGLMMLAPIIVAAEPTTRPIEDFINAQGKFCIEDGSGGCFLFVPPIKNFLGWANNPPTRFASVDYVGLANAHIVANHRPSLGTTMDGTITERELADGRAEVTVLLHTKNALTWVMEINDINNVDFANDPLLFGARASDVLAGQDAALGESFLKVVFINKEPGADLPDLNQLDFFPESGQELKFLSFQAQADGELREAFGVPDGTPGRTEVVQTGLFFAASKANTTKLGEQDAFPAESINLNIVGK